MNTRRQFFKQFIGQVGAIRDDIRGVDNIPLNRLNELPDDIIDGIVPVFFEDEQWEKSENSIILLDDQNNKIEDIHLSTIEEIAFPLLKSDIKLREVSEQLVSICEIPFDKAREITTTLFFKLASNRICHPHEVYNINALSTKSND